MENLLDPAFATGIKQGKLVAALDPKTRLQMVAVEDIGKLGKMAFIRHAELAGREIDLAGDELTMPEAAGVLTELLGRKVEFQRQPIAEGRAFSETSPSCWSGSIAWATTPTIPSFERTYGIELTRFRRWAEAHRQPGRRRSTKRAFKAYPDTHLKSTTCCRFCECPANVRVLRKKTIGRFLPNL